MGYEYLWWEWPAYRLPRLVFAYMTLTLEYVRRERHRKLHFSSESERSAVSRFGPRPAVLLYPGFLLILWLVTIVWTLFSVTDAVRWYYAPLLNDAEANVWLKNLSEGFGAGLYLLFALLFVQSNLSWNACVRPLCASAVWTAAVSALWVYHDKLSSDDGLRGVLALCAAAATTLLYMLLLTPPFKCRRAGRVFVAYQLSISSVLAAFNAVLVSQRSSEAFPSTEALLSAIYTRYLLPAWFALLPLAMYAVLYMDTAYWRGVIDDAFHPHAH